MVCDIQFRTIEASIAMTTNGQQQKTKFHAIDLYVDTNQIPALRCVTDCESGMETTIPYSFTQMALY